MDEGNRMMYGFVIKDEILLKIQIWRNFGDRNMNFEEFSRSIP